MKSRYSGLTPDWIPTSAEVEFQVFSAGEEVVFAGLYTYRTLKNFALHFLSKFIENCWNLVPTDFDYVSTVCKYLNTKYRMFSITFCWKKREWQTFLRDPRT
jgi:hypothetical protein